MKLFEVKSLALDPSKGHNRAKKIDPSTVKEYGPEVSWLVEFFTKGGTAKTEQMFVKWRKENPDLNIAHFVAMIEDGVKRNLKTMMLAGRYDLPNMLDAVKNTNVGSNGVEFKGVIDWKGGEKTTYNNMRKPTFEFDFVTVFDGSHNGFKSIDDLPKWFPKNAEEYNLGYNDIRSASGIHKRIGSATKLSLIGCPITSSILGILKIKGLKSLLYDIQYLDTDGRKAFRIIDSIIKDKKGNITNAEILAAQSEMLDKNLDEYAKL